MLRSLPTAAEPAATPISTVPADYMERVRQTHQQGGYGSLGYGYDWKIVEAEKNLLRTHTTAVSSRMLYRLAQVGGWVALVPVTADGWVGGWPWYRLLQMGGQVVLENLGPACCGAAVR